jgi:transposase-like protein
VRKPPDPTALAAAITEYRNGRGLDTAARRHGITRGQLAHALREAGHPIRTAKQPTYTHEQITEIVNAYRTGRTSTDVAAQYGVNPGSVRKWARLAGVHPEQPTRPASGYSQQMRDEAVTAHQAGDSIAAIAARLGVSNTTVNAWVADHRHSIRNSGLLDGPTPPLPRHDPLPQPAKTPRSLRAAAPLDPTPPPPTNPAPNPAATAVTAYLAGLPLHSVARQNRTTETIIADLVTAAGHTLRTPNTPLGVRISHARAAYARGATPAMIAAGHQVSLDIVEEWLTGLTPDPTPAHPTARN